MAYDRLAPLNRTELLLGQLLTLMANVYRDEKRQPQPYRLEQFVWDPAGPDPAEQRHLIAEGYQKMYAAVARRRAEKARAN
jgi:hypothetical protein